MYSKKFSTGVKELSKTKVALQSDEFPRSDSLEVVMKRVKGDIKWLLLSCAVAIGSGLLAGNLIKL